jgi:hypothetical protein
MMAFQLRGTWGTTKSSVTGEQIRIEGAGHDLRRAYKISEAVQDKRFAKVRTAIARAIDAHEKLVEEIYGS